MNLKQVMSSQKLGNAIDNAVTITGRNFIKFQDSIPNFTTQNGIYPYINLFNSQSALQNSFWGFWPGIIWLMYELLEKDYLKCYAEKQTRQIFDTIDKKTMSHSNHGLHVIPCSVPNLRVSGSETAKKTIIEAADSLTANFIASANVICSSDKELNQNTLCGMISNLINDRLLNFAYELTGDDKYKEIADSDKNTIINCNINSDGLVYFRRYFDKKTGDKLTNRGGLTYMPDKGTKARSYAWALLGLAINYSSTKNEFYAKKFELVFDYLCSFEKYHRFIHARINSDEKNYLDSTSTAIIVAALTDFLANDEIHNQKYFDILSKIMNMLTDKYSVNPKSGNEGLLTDGFMEKSNTNLSVIMGDYFYFETLLNLYKKRESFWYTKKVASK